MRTLIRSWNRFWFHPTSGHALGALRIIFGLIVLLNLAIFATDLDAWFTDAGYLRGSESRELAGPAWSESIDIPMRYSPLQLNRSPVLIKSVFAGTAVVSALFALGWQTRVMGIALYLGLLSIHHANFQTASGADVLLMIVCFLLMLSPCGAAYSLDARRRARKLGGAYSALVSPWAMRLIAIQISVVYFCTALMKAEGKSWIDGTALHYILNNGEARRFSFGLTDYPALINAMTYSALILEFALPFLLWVKAARPAMMIAGAMLHGGIMLTVNIPIFGELIVACYLCYLTPHEWCTIANAISLKRWFNRSSERVTIPGRVDSGHRALAGPHDTSVVVAREIAEEKLRA